jgi:threonine dehydrogenase-like Zn-dependent dehydrogenase
MCLTGNYTERGIKGRHGFMSERYADSPQFLVRVPAGLRRSAVLLEPMSIVQKGIEQAFRIQQRLTWVARKAVVLGAGPVGMLAALVLRLKGLDVHIAARETADSPKAHLVAEIGIHYVSTHETPLDQFASRIGRIDLVFEATGAASVVFPAMDMLGPNGVCILTGIPPGEQKSDVDVARWTREIVLGNRLVFGTVNAGRRHFEKGVRDLVAAEERYAGWLPRLVTRRLPFTDAASVRERAHGDIKTVLAFH